MTARLASAVFGLFTAVAVVTAGPNELSQAEIQGRQLAQQILEQQPAESFTNMGTLKIRGASGKTSEIFLLYETFITSTNWESFFSAGQLPTKDNRFVTFNLTISHNNSYPNLYRETDTFVHSPSNNALIAFTVTNLSCSQTMVPFADSDFWIADLGLEFFHWPEQKILKHEMRRGRACKVLESTNPNPSPNGNGYSRVVSWIDNETLGIVQAEAYDAKGKLLKEFYPKDFKKVNGQWELGEMEMINDQTGSRTWIKFDPKRHG